MIVFVDACVRARPFITRVHRCTFRKTAIMTKMMITGSQIFPPIDGRPSRSSARWRAGHKHKTHPVGHYPRGSSSAIVINWHPLIGKLRAREHFPDEVGLTFKPSAITPRSWNKLMRMLRPNASMSYSGLGSQMREDRLRNRPVQWDLGACWPPVPSGSRRRGKGFVLVIVN